MNPLVLLLVLLKLSAAQHDPLNPPDPDDEDQPFDPSLISYCQIYCMGMMKTSACSCFQVPDFTRIPGDPDFRQAILDRHNEIRNEIAGGLVELDNDKTLPPASDMTALSYDIELEYVAECHLLKGEMDEGNTCRKTSKFDTIEENIGFGDEELQEEQLPGVSLVEKWYEQYSALDNKTIHSYSGFGNQKISNVAHLLRASHAFMGCARALNSKFKKNIKFILVCLYADPEDSDNRGNAIYSQGTPCSSCPDCNQQYSSLCGEVEAVPMEDDIYIQELNTGVPETRALQKILLIGLFICLIKF